MGVPASSTTAEIDMQAHERTAISTHNLAKVLERFFDDVYSILKPTHLENICITLTIFIKTLSLQWTRKVVEN